MGGVKREKSSYFENLDGLRFLCFLSVFLYHSFYTEFDYIKSSDAYQYVKYNIFQNGNIGVNFFFVLSGFLITYLLLKEKMKYGGIQLKNFWMRRILRIWPLFYFCIFFGFVIFPFIKELFGQVASETASPYMYLLFLNNFDFIAKGLPDASVLGVLWSVAIEEQFYLLWPIIIYLFPVNRLWIPFALIILGSFLFRGYYNSSLLNEHHTISCIADMVVGAFGALLIIGSLKFKEAIVQMNKWIILLIYVSFIIVISFRHELLMHNYWVNIVERFIVATIIIMIILEQCFSAKSFFKMSKYKLISKLGLITYGLYCLHFIAILIVTKITNIFGINKSIWSVMLLETLLALILSIIISQLSFKYFEKPFLNFKSKFLRDSGI
jgi:peptidoglycan/LPS O-acetylase OafA/YrhL